MLVIKPGAASRRVRRSSSGSWAGGERGKSSLGLWVLPGDETLWDAVKHYLSKLLYSRGSRRFLVISQRPQLKEQPRGAPPFAWMRKAGTRGRSPLRGKRW